MSVSDYFAADYGEARGKFLDAALSAGASIASHQHPQPGPDGEPLFVDVARIGPDDADKMFMTISATHGVEGFCGSGVQIGSLKEGIHRNLPDGAALVMVHALNPYGFAWLRRTTEEGIDLYRNFMDFTQPLPENPVYDLLAQALVPREWSGPAREQADKAITEYVQVHGMVAFANEVPIGQYKYPFSLFYGGLAPTWSNRLFVKIAEEHLNGRRAVAAIDYHTGLGSYGDGELLCFHQIDGEAFRRAQQWWGERVASVYSGKSVAYAITGGLFQWLEVALKDVEFTATTYEFGTRPALVVLDALRGDNWLHNYGDPTSGEAVEIKRKIRDAFYCDEDEWRESVWKQSVVAQDAALRNLALS